MLGIEKLPKKQRLLYGKMFLLIVAPFCILLIIGANIYDSIKDFLISTGEDLEQERQFFIKYLTAKG